MAAGLSDIIKSLNLNELQEAAQYYAKNKKKWPVLETFEKDCLAVPEGPAVKLSEEDNEKLEILLIIYTYHSHYADNAKIQTKLASLISVQSQAHHSLKKTASNWNLAITTVETLRGIIFNAIEAEANKIKIDKERLRTLFPRTLTPNQTRSSDLDDIEKDYAGRIPHDLLNLLNSLCANVVFIADNAEIELKEKIEQITSLYESFVEKIKVRAEVIFSDVTKDTFFDDLYEIMQSSEEDKKEFTQDKIKELLVNSYMLMCCQYINTIMQEKVRNQEHQDKEIIMSSIRRIYQYIQSGESGVALIDHVTTQMVNEENLQNERANGDARREAVNALKNKIGYFSSLLKKDEKYIAILEVLSSIPVPSVKDQEYYLKIVDKLEELSKDNNKSKKISGFFKKDYAKKAVTIIQKDEALQQTISELIDLAKTLRKLAVQSLAQSPQTEGSDRRKSAPIESCRSQSSFENASTVGRVSTARSAPENQGFISLANARSRFHTQGDSNSCSSTSPASENSPSTSSDSKSYQSPEPNRPRKESC